MPTPVYVLCITVMGTHYNGNGKYTRLKVSLARPDHNAKAYGLVTLPHRSCSSGMCSIHKKKKSPTNHE